MRSSPAELPLLLLQPQSVLGPWSWQWVSWICLFSKGAQRWGSPAEVVCESATLRFQSVGLARLEMRVRLLPRLGRSLLKRRRLGELPFGFLTVLPGTAEVEGAAGAQTDPRLPARSREHDREMVRGVTALGGIAPPSIRVPGMSGASSWRAATVFSPWPRCRWLSSCHSWCVAMRITQL